jgi:proline iminopeptidase
MDRALGIALVLGLVACGGADASPEAQGSAPHEPLPSEAEALTPRTREIDAAGTSLFVREIGAGEEALIVINGGPGQSHDYVEDSDALATDALRVVTFDQRGTGRSARPADGDYTFAAYVADIEAVLDSLGLERAHLLGHSWGGLYALAFTAARPERVASLHLFGSSPATSAEEDSADFEARIRAFEDRGAFPAGYDQIGDGDDCAPYFQTIWPVYLHDPAFPMTEGVLRTTCSLATYVATAEANFASWDFSEALAGYAGPVFIAYGESDPFRAETASIAGHFKGTEPSVSELRGCGHYWQECLNDYLPLVQAELGAAE